MTSDEIVKVLTACQASGVSSFKMGELEVKFHGEALSPHNAVAMVTPQVSTPVSPISSEEEKEIKHKVEQLTSILKLDDTDLIDRMFPLPEQDQPEGAA